MIEMSANIDVDDLERGIEFYTKAFGLEVSRHLRVFAAVELVGASSRIYLLAKGAGTAPSRLRKNEEFFARHYIVE